MTGKELGDLMDLIAYDKAKLLAKLELQERRLKHYETEYVPIADVDDILKGRVSKK